MSKVLGAVAAVASIASFVLPPPYNMVAQAVAVVASVGASMTQKKPSAQGSVNEIRIGANLPTPYAMGRTYVGGNRMLDAGYGGTVSGVDNPYRSMVDVWSLGPIEEIEAFQADFETVAFSGGNAVGYYANYLRLATQIGQTPESAALAGPWGAIPGWDASSKLSGLAAGLPSLKFDKKGKIYASGVPQFGVILKGVWAYDPRLDSTYPGGSGDHRWYDESSWEWTENPALHAITYARGRYQNGKKVFGCGFPLDGIDLAPYVAWANVCDANGWKIGGVIFEPGSRWDNLKRICEAGSAEPCFVGARLSVRYSAPKVALDTIEAVDLADGEYEVPAMRSWRDRKNKLIPRYRSAEHKWEHVQAEAVTAATYVDEDGEEKEEEYPLDLVQDLDQAAQLTAYRLVNLREFGPIILPCKPRMLNYKIGEALVGGDTLEELGLAGQLLEITARQVDPATGIVTLTLASETTEKHAFALGQAGVAPPTPSLTSGEDLDEIVNANTYRSTPHVVADEAAMLALDVAEGEVAIRTDIGATFIHNGGTTGTVADWTEAPGGGAVALADGDYGDILVAGGGTTFTIDSHVVDFSKFIAATGAGLVGATVAGDFSQLTAAEGRTVLGLAVVASSGSAADLSGTLANARLDAFTGDATKPAGSGVLTLATVNSNTGTYGGAQTSAQISVDGKGRITGVSAITIAPLWSSILSTPTTLAGYGITNAQPLDATLTAFAAYNTNGFVAQTAADTFAGRTITGTANEIAVANGNGVSGNPTLSLPTALTFTGKTVTGGTYTGVTALDLVANAGALIAAPTGTSLSRYRVGRPGDTFDWGVTGPSRVASIGWDGPSVNYIYAPGGVNIGIASANWVTLNGNEILINGIKVLGVRGAALPAAATDLATAITLVNAIRSMSQTHGLAG